MTWKGFNAWFLFKAGLLLNYEFHSDIRFSIQYCAKILAPVNVFHICLDEQFYIIITKYTE